jgi:catechol 2,3-dioxygenase-like lactoylglutathione lyase family enzyme
MRMVCWLGSLAVIALTQFSGCGPAPQPVWNHDSRSFFFSKSDGSVVQYDLEKAASRTLIDAGERRPHQVAVNPKLPFIAFAGAALGSEGRAAQVGMASLLNGNINWHKQQVWGNTSSSRDLCPSLCHWCPKGRRVLVWFQQPAAIPGLIKSATPYGGFAVLDVTTGDFNELKGTPPAAALCQAIHVSPISGDGTGYLGMKLTDDTPAFVFVDWDGWESPLTLSDEVAALFKGIGNPQTPREHLFGLCFPIPQGTWDGPILRFALRAGVVMVDVKSRRITLQPVPENLRIDLEKITSADRADACFTLQTAAFSKGDLSLHYRMLSADKAAGRVRVDLVDRKLDRRRMLIEGHALENFFVHHLFPAPDGQRILACLKDPQTASFTIHMIELDGTVSANLDAGKFDVGELK